MPMKAKRSYNITSLQRGLRLLDLIAAGGGAGGHRRGRATPDRIARPHVGRCGQARNDIRQAVGWAPSVPDPSTLRLMTDLAARLLPHAAALPEPVEVRLVLTGPGGGTWDVTMGSAPAAATVAIVADAVGFCRLAANRLTPETLYDAQWALLLLGRATERLRQEHEATGKAETFAVLQGFLLLTRREQVITKDLGRGFLGRGNPTGIEDGKGVVAVKGAFFRIDGYGWIGQVGILLAFVRTDNKIFIHNCRAEIVWTFLEHLIGKGACAFSIVND